jgi:hypothetical protein
MTSVILTAVVGALWRRWLGGWKPFGKDITRLIKYGALSVFLTACLLLMGVGYLPTLLMIAVLIGGFSIGHGSWQDMGTMPYSRDGYLDHVLKYLPLSQGSVAYDFIGLALHYSLISVAGAFVLGAPLYAGAGLVAALGYLAFSKFQPRYTSTILDGWTAYAELLLGAVFVGGIALAL